MSPPIARPLTGSWAFTFGAFILLAACGIGGPPAPGAAPVLKATASDPLLVPRPVLGLDLYLPTPPDNPLTPKRVALGERLFFDPALSRDSTVACASCHRPELAFADTLVRSPGVDGRTPERATPTLVNRAWGRSHFRDGRAPTLEAAVLQPIAHPLEMDLGAEGAVARLGADPETRALFQRTFGEEGVTAENLARALAAYIRTLRSGNAPMDRFAAGDREALAEAEHRGRQLFLSKANCPACHAGPTFSDERFHNPGVAVGSGDPGRFLVTGREQDRGRFRTPTLREIHRTAPYMHDGSLATLEDVVDFYRDGGVPNPNLSREIRPLELSDEEEADLVAFLRALRGGVDDPRPPGRER